jgi:hypothetical protein
MHKKIEADSNNDLTINAGNDINLIPTANVNIPYAKKLTFGADTQKNRI